MKLRLVRRYHPICGTWWLFQKKTIFGWKDIPYIFNNPNKAWMFSQNIHLRASDDIPTEDVENKEYTV